MVFNSIRRSFVFLRIWLISCNI